MNTNEHTTPNDALLSEPYEAFLQRGEAAWQNYLRTGHAVPADEVFARIQAAFDAKRATLTAQSSIRDD